MLHKIIRVLFIVYCLTVMLSCPDTSSDPVDDDMPDSYYVDPGLADVTNITLISSDTINTTNDKATVVFEVEAVTNEDYVLTSIETYIVGESGKRVTDYSSSTEYTGTATSGTFSVNIIIPQYYDIGIWKLNRILISGKKADGTSAKKVLGVVQEAFHEFDRADWDCKVTNIATIEDLTVPEVTNVSVTPLSLDVKSDAGMVTLSVSATDDCKLSSTDCAFMGPNGETTVKDMYGTALSSGTIKEGTFNIDLIVPQGSTPGIWELLMIAVYDSYGRCTYFYDDDLTTNGIDCSFTILDP